MIFNIRLPKFPVLCATLAISVLVSVVLASSATARNVYVPNYDSDNVAVLDATTGQVVAPPIAFPSGESGPWTSAVAPDGKTAYIVNYDGEYVSAVDTATNQIVGPKMAVGNSPYGIAITPDGKKAYVANPGDEFVSVLDLQGKTVLPSVTVGSDALEIAIAPDGTRAYVGYEDGVSIIDTATDTVVGTIPLPDSVGGIAITPDGKVLVVTVDDTVTFIDTATNQVLGTPVPANNAYIPAITPDGKRAYVTDGSDEQIYVFDIASRQLLPPITVPGGDPEYVAFNPGGSRLFSNDYDAGAVLVFDPMTNQGTGPAVPVGEGPGKLSVMPDQSPTASFAPPATRIRPGVLATLSGAASTDSDGGIATYAWQLGDGGAEAGPASTVTHTFAAPGEYRVTLTVTDNEGCSVALVFTGATAYCHGSPAAAQTQTVTVKYPGVKVKCPKKAGPKGCKFKLKAVKKTGKGKKQKLKAQSAVAKAKVKAGKSAIVSLKPKKKFAKKLATAKKVLVQKTVTADGETTTKVSKLKIVQ